MVRTYLRAAVLPFFVLLAIAACSGSDSEGGGGAGNGDACGTCAQVYTNGGISCGPGSATDAWETLAHCACGGGVCAQACTASFCMTLPADVKCGECLMTSCSAQEMGCAAN